MGFVTRSVPHPSSSATLKRWSELHGYRFHTRLLPHLPLRNGFPATWFPSTTHLWFAPDLEKETFRGRESIDVVLTEPSTTVTLHAAEITFSEVTITSGGRTQTATRHAR